MSWKPGYQSMNPDLQFPNSVSMYRFQDLVVSPCLYLEKGEIIGCTSQVLGEN